MPGPRRVAAVATQSDAPPRRSSVTPPPRLPQDDSPFINDFEDIDNSFDDDGFIDDNPLVDIDQFRLKIDMDDFIVHDATICDPILAKPISSWIDEDLLLSQSRKPSRKPSLSKEVAKETSNSLPLDVECSIFSNSSGVSTLSSLDLRGPSKDDDATGSPIQRSLSADQIDKAVPMVEGGKSCKFDGSCSNFFLGIA